VKALNKQIKELKADTDTLRRMLKEKQRELSIQSGKYELTIKDLNEDLDEARKLINIMVVNKEKLISALSDKNKELEEKKELLKRKEEKLKKELEEIAELSMKLKKKESSTAFGRTSLIILLIAVILFAIIMRH
jgi:chromosome segregation ATPase